MQLKVWNRPAEAPKVIYCDARKVPPTPIRKVKLTSQNFRVGAIAQWKRTVGRVTVTSWVVIASEPTRRDRTPNLYCAVLSADKGVQQACLNDLFLTSEVPPPKTMRTLRAIASRHNLEVSDG